MKIRLLGTTEGQTSKIIDKLLAKALEGILPVDLEIQIAQSFSLLPDSNIELLVNNGVSHQEAVRLGNLVNEITGLCVNVLPVLGPKKGMGAPYRIRFCGFDYRELQLRSREVANRISVIDLKVDLTVCLPDSCNHESEGPLVAIESDHGPDVARQELAQISQLLEEDGFTIFVGPIGKEIFIAP